MIKKIALLLVATVLLACSKSSTDIMIVDAAGKVVSTQALLKDKPTIVNLWATWCAPCVRELPLLVDFARDNPDWQVLFINQGEDEQRVERFLQQRQLTLKNLYYDKDGLWTKKSGAKGFPVSIVFRGSLEPVKMADGALTAASLSDLIAAQ